MERCEVCKFFTCETKEINGKVVKTIQSGGDIFQRGFEINDCELRKEPPCVGLISVQEEDTIKITPQ